MFGALSKIGVRYGKIFLTGLFIGLGKECAKPTYKRIGKLSRHIRSKK